MTAALKSTWAGVVLLCLVASAIRCASPAGSLLPCTPGQVCMTDNPGACMAGHTTCMGNTFTCVPDATEQPCYRGVPTTLGVGICKAGTQSCVGGLGPCMGEVVPTAKENCFNELDDDCDGKVNNGCPKALVIGTVDALVARGGTGGSSESSRCPSGTVVTAVQVLLSDPSKNPGYVVSAQPVCAKPELTRDANAYSVQLTPVASPSPIAGSDPPRSGTSHITCAGGGFSVANGTLGSIMNGSRTVVESFGINCSIVGLALDQNNQMTLMFNHDAANSGSASVQVNGAPWNDNCGANEVLVGFDGRTGAQMDQIQGICAPITITYN
jgi:hypothetical protein